MAVKNSRKAKVMRAYILSISLVYCVFSVTAWAQDSAAKNETDIFIKGFIAMPSLLMSINGAQTDLTHFDPNRTWSTGIGIAWGDLTLSVSTQTGAPIDDPALYGETSYFDIQLQHYDKQLGIDGFYQSYKGYFIRDLPTGCERGEACSLRPRLQLEHLGTIAYYVFDPRWSMRAAFNPPGRQSRSAGSWFLTGGFNILAVDNDEPLLDGLDPPIEDARFYMASAALGYGYTWVKGRWFLASALYFGGGPMYLEYSASEENASANEWELAIKAGVKLGAGYTGNTWQAGIRVLADSPYARPGDIEFNWIAQTVELYAGRQF